MSTEVGSMQWIQERDQLRDECACHDPRAVQFLAALGAYVELWDDLIDKDKALPEDHIHNGMAGALLDIACNPWFQQHVTYLTPLLVQMVSAYLTSEELCRDPDRKVRGVAFHLRNYPLEFYPAVAFLTGGMAHMRDMERKTRRFFAFEAFEDWEYANG